MALAFVIVGAVLLIAAFIRVQLRRAKTAPIRDEATADSVRTVVNVDVMPKAQLETWGKSLVLMKLTIREHSVSLTLGDGDHSRLGSALGSEWRMLSRDTTMRREQISSALGDSWIVLSAVLARMFNIVLQGWINYYGRFYKSMLYPVFRHLNDTLVRWAMKKYKRLRRRPTRARRFLADVARRQPGLFAHWRFGVRPDGWTMGAR